MQNRTFLVLLRPIFCQKLKIAPPIRTQPPLKRLKFRFWPKNQSQFRWRPFFFFFFGDHLILGGKGVWISELSEKFRLNFRTNRVKLIQEQWKFGSRMFVLFSLFQNSPPPPPPPLFQILATRLRIREEFPVFCWFFESCYGNSIAARQLRASKIKWRKESHSMTKHRDHGVSCGWTTLLNSSYGRHKIDSLLITWPRCQ